MSTKTTQKYSIKIAKSSLPQKWNQSEISSMTSYVTPSEPVTSGNVYSGSVVMVLFGLALVLTSLVSLFRQRYITNVSQGKVKLKVKDSQHVNAVAISPTASKQISSASSNDARHTRLKVRRQPCSLERFTQIEKTIEAAVAGVLVRRYEIGVQDWAVIKDFWDGQIADQNNGLVVATPSQLFEPVSVDDYVEIKMTVSHTTEEVLIRMFNLTLSDWLRIRLYWYQKFAKDELLTQKYRNSMSKHGISAIALAA